MLYNLYEISGTSSVYDVPSISSETGSFPCDDPFLGRLLKAFTGKHSNTVLLDDFCDSFKEYKWIGILVSDVLCIVCFLVPDECCGNSLLKGECDCLFCGKHCECLSFEILCNCPEFECCCCPTLWDFCKVTWLSVS